MSALRLFAFAAVAFAWAAAAQAADPSEGTFANKGSAATPGTPQGANAPLATRTGPLPACALKEVANLDMSTQADGTVTVPVTINSLEAMLEVDTGSIYSSIAIPIVNQLKLPHRDLPKGMFSFFNGVDVHYMTSVDNFLIGHTRGNDMEFLVEPYDVSDLDQDGLLGPDIMHQYDAEFDFAGGKFSLFLPEHCPGNVIYWTDAAFAAIPMQVDRNWQITIEVVLDGKHVKAIVDTGASRSALTLEAARELFGLDEHSANMTSLGDLHLNEQTGTLSYRFPFSTMDLNGIVVRNPDLILVPEKTMGEGPPLLLGISILRQLHLYIAYKEQVLYATAAQAPPRASRPIAGPPLAGGQIPSSSIGH